MTLFRPLLLATALAAALPLSAAVVQSVDRSYDALGHLLKETYPNGGWQQYSYDAMGRRLSSTDHLGRTTRYSYDALGRLSTVTDPAQGLTRYDYDVRDNLVKVTDPRGLVTQYTYSGFDDLIAQTSPDTGTSSATFIGAGLLASRTDAKGQTTGYGYDGAGRLSSITYQDQSTVSYGYDTFLSSITDSSGKLGYGYDCNGWLSNKTYTAGNKSYAVGYGYDYLGRINRLSYPSGRTVSYSYNAAGQLSQIDTQPSGGPSQTVLSNISYRAFGPAQGWTYGNGQVRSSSYDLEGHLTGYSLGDSNVTLSYDPAGRLTGQSISGGWWQRLLQSLGVSAGQEDQYGYDQLDRLTSWQGQAASLSYEYDADGNRLLLKRNDNAYPQYVSNASNQIVSVDGPEAQGYSYDGNGNRTADAHTSYIYDARGRLIQGGGASYTLNSLGQRTGKAYQGQTTLYHYDAAGNLIAETNDQGQTLKEYIYLQDTPVAVIDGTTVRYLHTDHLGTPRLVTDADQHAVWSWQGEPFGNEAANEDPEGRGSKYTLNLRFPGQYYDQETGNHYNLNRDYDPKLGRYLQSDPIGLGGGINTYAYAEGNPISKSDPQGLAVELCGGRPDTYLHFWLCANGKCAGLQPAGDWKEALFGGPGKVQRVENGSNAQASACKTVEPEKCDQKKFEACIASNLRQRSDADTAYGLYSHRDVNSCYTWALQTIDKCVQQVCDR